MESTLILENIKIAIDILLEQDKWLMQKNVSERSITHKLAEHIQDIFPDYNVDCEYNGDVKFGEMGRKQIFYIKQELNQHGLLTNSEILHDENEIANRFVYPDIIIHQRGSNDDNLCVVELKKSMSQISSQYDEIKLMAYTTSQWGNELKYQLGIFIEVITGEEELDYTLRLFQNGTQIENL